jgi:hypothetical protein
MAHNSDLPDHLVDAILASIHAVVPDVVITRESARVVEYQSTVRTHNQLGRYSRVVARYAQMAVRNRDGISPTSIAWVVWNNLETLLDMSRRSGTPFPAEQAASMQAYAQPVADEIHAWLLHTDTMQRVDLPAIPLVGVRMEPPRGLRLPFRLPHRYELPTDGRPVTSPDNQL